MQLRFISVLIYSLTCPSSERKKHNSNWKGSLFQLQLHSCDAALPFQMTDCQRSHSQRMIKMHFSPLLLLLRGFVYHLFGRRVEKKAARMQQRKVSIFCWLIMDGTHLTPLKQPLLQSGHYFLDCGYLAVLLRGQPLGGSTVLSS